MSKKSIFLYIKLKRTNEWNLDLIQLGNEITRCVPPK
ncbi:hypothetical protein IKC_04299 [Bacillus cereus VD184]|uniref:Uncharacterized protein n=1 Tax=Bacillus cereus VD184 TaxID=1053242 RepID=A0A9W5RC18_BACCE|nr:hypothetical protein IKC_05190 [Bacillus cereus VD184]EOQ19825.1 hypothetical protein IKC_04299 [Bacillus cereus VD184]